MVPGAVHRIGVLILTSILIASVTGQGETTVSCRVSENCDGAPGDDRLGNLTSRQCCVENSEGRAYTVNGVCTPCTVFGFFTDSFTDEEQGEAYTVQVGYLKRPSDSEAGTLRFDVISIPGSAREGIEFDYTVSTNSVPALMDGSTRDVIFQFRTDSIAQETNETFSLELQPGFGVLIPTGEGVFFLNVVNMTIIDGDEVNVMFSEDDFRATEGLQSSVPVLVTKTSRIATPIVLEVRPLTVQEANMASNPPILPPNVPPENLVSPPFANLQDFNNTIITITFESDELEAINEIRTPIIIVDDVINEATEQVFVVQLHLIRSESPEKAILTERPASLCRIVDNDPIRIGFELPQYTFMEPMFETEIDMNFEPTSGLPVNGPVYFAKENITSEQTFQVFFQVLETPPTSSQTIDPATINLDYLFAGGTLSVSRLFPPNLQKIDFIFSLLSDNLPEETEAFRVLATSGGGGIEGELLFPQFSTPVELSTDTFVIIEDDDIIDITIGFEETVHLVNESQVLEVFVRVFDPPESEMLPIEVNLVIQTLPGSATGGDDYRDINAEIFDVFLIFDDANRRRSFLVTTFDDDLQESEETFDLELRFDPLAAVPPEGVTLLPSLSTVIIVDDDVGPLDMVNVSFERETYTVGDGDGFVEICFTTNTGHTEPIEVEVLPTEKPGVPLDMRATAFNDFIGGVQRQTFEASDFSARQCVNISIIDDTLTNELDQLFLVTFNNLPDTEAGVFVGPIAQACVTIQDDDEPIFSIGPNITVDESTPSVNICVTTSSAFSRDLVVTAVTGPKNGAQNQATSDLDYTHTTLMFTFGPQDEGSQTDCDSVDIIDDLLGNELDEEFSVTLINVTASGSEEACITIIDNDTPEVEWEIPETAIPEGENRVVCFTTDIGTAVPYQVEIGARVKGTNPATGSDYTFQPQAITIPVSPSGSRFCVDVSAITDTEVEGVEQFELYFENLPSTFATVGEIDTVCVNITDGMPPPDFLICEITEPIRVKPFSRSTRYGFMGPCEHVAFSSCQSVDGNNVRVTVDFLTDSLENGAVGLHVGDLRYVSREDGSFDDGGQTPLATPFPGAAQYAPTPESAVIVERGDSVTTIQYSETVNVSLSDPGSVVLIVFITHTHGAEENASIAINVQTPTDSNIQDFCGLCGTRNGDLLKRDGTIANIFNMAEVQNFAQCNLVEPRNQILRPQRRECGTIRNDTVIGDPLYAAPVYSEDGKEYSLCYEVFGRTNSTLNLVSDTCVNVNARYGPMNNPLDGNIINAVGVRAKGLSDNSCYNIRVDLDGCSAQIDSANGLAVLDNMQSFEQDGISVRKYPRRVRIAAPNCENVMLVMWVICENRNDNQDMIKFVIARGVNLRASSHGLLGQFWNVPVTFAKFTGDLPSFILAPENYYLVTVAPESSSPRRFLGEFYTQKWDFSNGPCLYVGNAQGGPSFEVDDPNDSVIEGYYREYIIESGDLFETEYKYNQFEEERC